MLKKIEKSILLYFGQFYLTTKAILDEHIHHHANGKAPFVCLCGKKFRQQFVVKNDIKESEHASEVGKRWGTAARDFGADIETGVHVNSIDVCASQGIARGVTLSNGEKLSAKVVISNATPHKTLMGEGSSEFIVFSCSS